MNRILAVAATVLALAVLSAGSARASTGKPVPPPRHKPAAKAVTKPAPVKPVAKKKAVRKITGPRHDGSATSLPVPRFVTLGADEVNLRTGPGFRYPIRLVIRKAGLPVEILREFDVWREVRDRDGSEGWVHKSMLSGRRGVVILGAARTLLDEPHKGARPVVRLEPGVIAGLSTCSAAWCRLKIAGYEGWLPRGDVWGVYPRETFQE